MKQQERNSRQAAGWVGGREDRQKQNRSEALTSKQQWHYHSSSSSRNYSGSCTGLYRLRESVGPQPHAPPPPLPAAHNPSLSRHAPPPYRRLAHTLQSCLTFSVLLASMDRSDRQTLLIVRAGDQPPFWPSYRMSRQMWPLLWQVRMCVWGSV